jgi:hypothetical protein
MEAPWNENASSSAIDSKGDRQKKVLIDLTLVVSSSKFKSLLLQMSSIARDTMISSPLEQEDDDEL